MYSENKQKGVIDIAYIGQKAINSIFDEIEENEYTLSDNINFHDDNGSDKVHVMENGVIVFTSYSSYEIYSWLSNNNHLIKV